jgi:hypothetical protein
MPLQRHQGAPGRGTYIIETADLDCVNVIPVGGAATRHICIDYSTPTRGCTWPRARVRGG